MSVEGVDYAFSRPSIAALAAAGKRFACRYGGAGTSGKWLTLAEARALTAAGLSIVANAEGAADGMRNGYNVGVAWAELAEQHFATCGMPPDRPIYLSADFDVTATTWPAVRDALRGAASRIGYDRVGVYGSYDVMMWARRDRVASWFWQTYAWSETRWAPGNHIEQYRNGVTLGGGTVDLNRALPADYGQWSAEGADVDSVQDAKLSNANANAWAVAQLDDTYQVIPGNAAGAPPVTVANELARAVAELRAGVADLKARPPAQLTDAQVAALAGQITDAVAERVADELRDRLAQ